MTWEFFFKNCGPFHSSISFPISVIHLEIHPSCYCSEYKLQFTPTTATTMRCVCLSYTNEQIIPTEFDNNDLITPLAWGLARIQEALPAGCSRTWPPRTRRRPSSAWCWCCSHLPAVGTPWSGTRSSTARRGCRAARSRCRRRTPASWTQPHPSSHRPRLRAP